MADKPLAPPFPTDPDVALLHDSKEALERSRVLLAQIEALLALRHPWQIDQNAEASSSPCLKDTGD